MNSKTNGTQDMSQYLEDVEFPCSKEDLVQSLRDNGADESMIQKV